MNDNNALGTVRDSLTTARDSLTEVHMTTPLDTIVRHGRARRRRHRLTGLAGAAVVAVGAVLAVTALLPASHPASHQPRVQLAAWTVVSSPAALSMSPSASCAIRLGCKPRSAPMASRPASPSETASRRHVGHTPEAGSSPAGTQP